MNGAEKQYAESQVGNLRAQRNEAKRPMVERATAITTTVPLLIELIERVACCRQRVADQVDYVGGRANALLGPRPESDEARAADAARPSGAVGMLADEIAALEIVVGKLEAQAARLGDVA